MGESSSSVRAPARRKARELNSKPWISCQTQQVEREEEMSLIDLQILGF